MCVRAFFCFSIVLYTLNSSLCDYDKLFMEKRLSFSFSVSLFQCCRPGRWQCFCYNCCCYCYFFIVWFDMCESERESVHSAIRVCIVCMCVCVVQFVYLLFNSSQHWRFVFGNMKLSRQRTPPPLFLFFLLLFHHLNYSWPYRYLWVWTQAFAVFMQF